MKWFLPVAWVEFQFTLPCRERLEVEPPLAVLGVFQFTLPCRERPRYRARLSAPSKFQFTLPCRERHPFKR